MTIGPALALSDFAKRRILVLGDCMLDSYLHGTSGRLCPDAPVPVVNVASRQDVPGGAANTAASVHSLGAEPILLSAVGDDVEGRLLCDTLGERGVSSDNLIVRRGSRTLAKHRVMAGSQMLVRFDQGSTLPITGQAERQLLDKLTEAHGKCDAIIVSDYDYGLLTPAVIAHLRALQRRRKRILVVDSKRLGAYQALRPTAVKPNYEQAMELLGHVGGACPPDRAEALLEHAPRLLAQTAARIVAVSLDSDGALVLERDKPAYRTYATRYRSVQTSGAGDTYLAALTLAIAAQAETTAAAEIAAAAAAVVVAKDGTAYCTLQELQNQICLPGKQAESIEQLALRVEAARHEGRRVVLTCGCFDILHRGHITYLSQAKALGDLVVVAVNSDDSIRRLKGPGRPINAEQDRLDVLAALSCIDHLVLFNDDTPESVVAAVRPDVFVKGGDYAADCLPERALVERLGGRVHILPFIADRSTTRIIEQIRTAHAPADAPSQVSPATASDAPVSSRRD
jgi:D-beta-D-heptose 7-phosphate kinase/D-beta-D-heptose 1-phosphate adenosyltransferase